MLCTGGMTEVYRYISFMAYMIDNMCSRLARYIDGLMQKRRNSSALSRRYGVSFNLTRWAPTSGEILSAILNNITSLLTIHSKSLIAREILTRMPNFVVSQYCACRWKRHYRTSTWILVIGTGRWQKLSLGIYSLSGKTSYHQSFEAAKLDIMIIVSLWHLTVISPALLWWCLLNFKAI